MNIAFCCLPFFSALVGWLIFRLALKIYFHPAKHLSILGFRINTFLFNRRNNYIKQISNFVATQFVANNDLASLIADEKYFNQAKPFIEENIDDFLKNKLPQKLPVISMFITNKTLDSLKATFMAELETLFPGVVKKYFGEMLTKENIENIITEKLTEFSDTKWKNIIDETIAKKFWKVELLGALFGFIIGVVQLLLEYLLIAKF